MRRLEASPRSYLFHPPADQGDDPVRQSHVGGTPSRTEDLPYCVEVWDGTKQVVEQVLAVTVSASIGYAAYFAATKEYPDRTITLRYRGRVVSRWDGSAH